MSKRALESQESITFEYYEMLGAVVRDLEHIDALIPSEAARYGCLSKDREAQAIIERRKQALLSYIQIICRDHVHYLKKLIATGWTAKQRGAVAAGGLDTPPGRALKSPPKPRIPRRPKK